MSAVEVSPLQLDDIDEYTALRYDVFASSDEGLISCFFPLGKSPTTHNFLRPKPEEITGDPDNAFFLMRDAQTQTILGAAHWDIQREPKSIDTVIAEEEEATQKRLCMKPVEGVNLHARNAFRKAQAKCHREALAGRAHVYLHLLVVVPEHQRRGAGTAALKKCIAVAEELGLPVYLESTTSGKLLYERHGFKTLGFYPLMPEILGTSIARSIIVC